MLKIFEPNGKKSGIGGQVKGAGRYTEVPN